MALRAAASGNAVTGGFGEKRAQALRKLDAWAKYKAPNYFLAFWGALYIFGTIVVFAIGYSVLLEVSDDLTANVAYDYIHPKFRPGPCGLPGTDALHLLQSFDLYERDFGMPQLIEPSYATWVKQVKSAVCAGDTSWQSDGADGTACENDPTANAQECLEDQAREVRAIAQLLKNWTINPGVDETTNLVTATTIAQADWELTENTCQTYVNDNGAESFYSHRLRMAYGDLKTRVARAYVAAAPSFYRYASRLTENNNQGCLAANNPFLTDACANSDHVNVVLERAGTADASAQLAGVANAAFPTRFSEQVYALLALAVVSNYDRTINAGECFRNKLLEDAETNNDDAMSFCADVYTGASFPAGGNVNPMLGYAATETTLMSSYKCDWFAKQPPSPPNAPPFTRDEASTVANTNAGVLAVCANLLQYGLFDQGRLFGIPDIMKSFVIDARVGASSHVLAPPNYNSLYFNVVDNGGSAFYNPIRRLETYLAYRLASITIWGMVIGSAVGFFFARAAIPLLFQVLRIAGIKNKKGETPFFTRPTIDTPTFLASIIAILGGYWTLYTDPAIQSHYPTTGECADWLISEDHSSAGVYVTSWGKRRFGRYGEQQLGVVMFALAGFPLIYSTISIVVDPRIRFWRSKKIDWVAPGNVTFWVIFGCCVISQSMLAWEATQSGRDWRLTAESQGDTAPEVYTLTKDCKASVMIAFWSGAVAGAARCRWVVQNLDQMWQALWVGTCVTLVWIQVIQYLALLPDEWEDAFKVPTADSGRLARIWVLLGSCIVQTLLFLWNWRVLCITGLTSSASKFYRFLRQRRVKEQVIAESAQVERTDPYLAVLGAADAEHEFAPVRPFSFDLMKKKLAPPPTGERFNFKFTDAQLRVGDETGYTTALPPPALFDGRRRKDRVLYIPMLKFHR